MFQDEPELILPERQVAKLSLVNPIVHAYDAHVYTCTDV